jgi:fructose 1,6-bisphosphatase
LKLTGKLQPLDHFNSLKNTQDLNPLPKLGYRSENEELIFLDDLTQEDKFYLIQQIESKISKNIRYNGNLIAKTDQSTLENEYDSIPEIQDSSSQRYNQ